LGLCERKAIAAKERKERKGRDNCRFVVVLTVDFTSYSFLLAMELRGQVRSQMEFGNEGAGSAKRWWKADPNAAG